MYPETAFPAPNVDSAVIRLNIRKEPPVKLETEENSFQIGKKQHLGNAERQF